MIYTNDLQWAILPRTAPRPVIALLELAGTAGKYQDAVSRIMIDHWLTLR